MLGCGGVLTAEVSPTVHRYLRQATQNACLVTAIPLLDTISIKQRLRVGQIEIDFYRCFVKNPSLFSVPAVYWCEGTKI